MTVFPAIDIINGKCVRLKQGQYDKITIFSDDPVSMALQFQKAGAKFVHVVDLDGARGDGSNRDIIGTIAKSLDIPVQTGGGIRTMEDIDEVLGLGITRVILGTSAVKNPHLVADAVKKYGDRIVVGIDAKDGYVAIEGWEKTSSVKALELAEKMESMGVSTIIYTDINTDGMLAGPNIFAMKEMVSAVGMDVIASGGVSSLKDIRKLKETGVAGVIVGKAIYTGDVELKQALLIAEEL
ncbi:MAG TPA: 1-(5-phosphoribosyl)-5-[(5-phosphoribosylamino)methylideneamino]imidazole-4-carboxamide isomerase [Clostridiaceae bacterium]|jgi:phosphoribosylformimino-5-aminoimidazole carboxamide ribotide isomerase|nr:1-(5-phosphoribosyl)-5-[(5-phosphoribosylamino)methylideneamino]imidazole-4-carboxamide isomerase [Clostridiaceae bacterium]